MSIISNFLGEQFFFIYQLKHISISQWDVENTTKMDAIEQHSQRQLR
jgi:hypothetical protein